VSETGPPDSPANQADVTENVTEDEPKSAAEGAREPYEIRIIEDRWATFRHVVEAVAIVAAGSWAFYTFIYQEKIKPASEPAAISVSIAVNALEHDGKRDILGLAIELKNTGKTEVDIAADGYNVWGEKYGTRPVMTKRERPTRREFDGGLPIVSRHLIMAFAELRDGAAGGRKGQHIIIEPGASETISNVFAVTHGAYDIIHAQVIAVPIKTTLTDKVPVKVITSRAGAYYLDPGPNYEEDDNNSDFALPP
jgi:hypothetical protein